MKKVHIKKNVLEKCIKRIKKEDARKASKNCEKKLGQFVIRETFLIRKAQEKVNAFFC